MKLIAKFILVLVSLYVALWMSLAGYFTFSERHAEILERSLTNLFGRVVTIESVYTEWHGTSPSLQINGFAVAGDEATQPALAFQTLSARLDPISLLNFWPRFTDIAIEQPVLEIVSLPTNQLQIAGFILNSNQSSLINPKQIINWLLNNEGAAWHEGTIVWRRSNNEVDRYEDISFVYERVQQRRLMQAVVNLPSNNTFAFKAISHGDVINSRDWDASLEVLANDDIRLLGSDELSMTVTDGQGQLLLKTLEIQQVRDFLQLTGIGGTQNWVMQSQLSGLLSDVQFNFSGPLLDFNDWSLNAAASAVSFISTGNVPAMSNLSGALAASSEGGIFDFATNMAEFSWPRWFQQPFPINQASGRFSWDLSESETITIMLSEGVFSDQIANIRNLSATAQIDTGKSRIRNFAELFKIESLQDLSFEDGDVINRADSDRSEFTPFFLDASAEFEVPELASIEQYFPNDSRILQFRSWWQQAMLSGSATNGRISYRGRVSKDALYDGSARLAGTAEFNDLTLDYGYERDWPILSRGRGIAKIDNAALTFFPDEAWLEDDQIDNASVEINSIYRADRSLNIRASMQTSLPKVTDFLFAGPLINKQDPAEQTTNELPISAESGAVDADIQINIPLSDFSQVTVNGAARVVNGRLVLPQGVPVVNLMGDVSFTENSATSNNIRGEFLGGQVQARLTTVEPAQPPKLQLNAVGNAEVTDLQPWLGEHLLSWLTGVTSWQGRVDIDGPQAQIGVNSDLMGVSVLAPAPLYKNADSALPLSVEMLVGKGIAQSLSINLGDALLAKFVGDLTKNNQFTDKSIISLNGDDKVKPGINFDINDDNINLDEWMQAIIGLSKIKNTATQGVENSLFLDAMRTVKVNTKNPYLLGRKFGALELSATSSNGGHWIGSITGDNIDGIIQAEPRGEIPSYSFNLAKLHISEGPKQKPPLSPIDYSLMPSSYPIIDLKVNSFRFVRKQLGQLHLRGEPIDDVWKLTDFKLDHQGVSTTASGEWENTREAGTMTRFSIETTIDEAGGALQELDMGGLVSKGEGTLNANIYWNGAPHEFDYSRLNGDFDLRVQDGELVKVEPGTGKLLGLLNFNAIARRLTLDFSDVISSGLEFDRMRYSGLFADGIAIMREAYIFTPAVFVRMEGKLDLVNEMIDMEIHLSPELGGNLTLLSALANPAAGAVMFLTQQIFKDEMRAASYKNYRAFGSWEDFEMVEFNLNDDQADNTTQNRTDNTN